MTCVLKKRGFGNPVSFGAIVLKSIFVCIVVVVVVVVLGVEPDSVHKRRIDMLEKREMRRSRRVNEGSSLPLMKCSYVQ